MLCTEYAVQKVGQCFNNMENTIFYFEWKVNPTLVIHSPSLVDNQAL